MYYNIYNTFKIIVQNIIQVTSDKYKKKDVKNGTRKSISAGYVQPQDLQSKQLEYHAAVTHRRIGPTYKKRMVFCLSVVQIVNPVDKV